MDEIKLKRYLSWIKALDSDNATILASGVYFLKKYLLSYPKDKKDSSKISISGFDQMEKFFHLDSFKSFLAENYLERNFVVFYITEIKSILTKIQMHYKEFDQYTLLLSLLNTDLADLETFILTDFNLKENYRYEETTPSEINKLCALLLSEASRGKSVLDLCCGKGSFLLQNTLLNARVYIGVEIVPTKALIAEIRLVIAYSKRPHFKTHFSILNEDCFKEPTERADAVFSNYPFTTIPNSAQVRHQLKRTVLGLTSLDTPSPFFFIDAALSAMKPDGKGVVLAMENCLTGETDYNKRKQLIEKGLLEGIIALPNNSLEYTTSAPYLLILGHNDGKIKMLDATKMILTKSRRLNIINAEEIVLAYNEKALIIPTKKILENNYSLSLSFYTKKENKTESQSLGDVGLLFTGWQTTSAKLDLLYNREYRESSSDEKYVQLLQLADVKGVEIFLNNRLFLVQRKAIEKYGLKDQDILISTKSSNIKIAMFRAVPNEIVLASSSFIVLRVNKTKSNPFYVYAFLLSQEAKLGLESLQTGIRIRNLTIQNAKKLKVPMLPKDQMENIGLALESNLKAIKEKEAEIRKIKSDNEKLFLDNAIGILKNGKLLFDLKQLGNISLSGPTGSGKTQYLYHFINTCFEKKIISKESTYILDYKKIDFFQYKDKAQVASMEEDGLKLLEEIKKISDQRLSLGKNTSFNPILVVCDEFAELHYLKNQEKILEEVISTSHDTNIHFLLASQLSPSVVFTKKILRYIDKKIALK